MCAHAYTTDLLFSQRVAACGRPGLVVAGTPWRRRHSQWMCRGLGSLGSSRLQDRLGVSPPSAATGAGRQLSRHEALRLAWCWVLRGLVVAVRLGARFDALLPSRVVQQQALPAAPAGEEQACSEWPPSIQQFAAAALERGRACVLSLES